MDFAVQLVDSLLHLQKVLGNIFEGINIMEVLSSVDFFEGLAFRLLYIFKLVEQAQKLVFSTRCKLIVNNLKPK